MFRKARSITQAELIRQLNPKIRGWANYHRGVVSKAIFNKIDKTIWNLTLKWAKRRHPKKNMQWIFQKYYKSIKGVNHRFSGFETQKDGTQRQHTLLLMSYTPIRRHIKILGPAHPYDAKYDEYFEKRTSDKWRNNSGRIQIEGKLTMFQESKCPNCEKELSIKDLWYISLKKKASIGGEYVSGNMDIVHKQCYEEWQNKKSISVPATDTKGGFKRA